MKTDKIPTRWACLHTGDMLVSRIPLHRMKRYAEVGRFIGYRFQFDPHPRGYLVTCTASPHDKRGTQ